MKGSKRIPIAYSGAKVHRSLNSLRQNRAVALGALLLTLCTLAIAAPSASALSLGLMWTGGYDQTPNEMEEVGRSGAQLFRMAVNPEHSANGADWTYYDKVFGNAAKHGVRILPQIGGTLSGQPGLPTVTEQGNWTAWLQEAVRRYGYNGKFWLENPGIPARPATAWELGNEPNNESFGAITPQQYGNFLAWAGPAVQNASKAQANGQGTAVLFAGLLAWSGGTGYQSFLKSAHEMPGASSAYTGLGFHPYLLDPSKFAPDDPITAFKKAVNGARNFLNTLPGGANKSLWITETGWPVAHQWAVSEGTQATYLKQAFGWLKGQAGALNLQAAFWYNYRDIGVETWQYKCGLRDGAGNYRLSWWAFQEQAGVQFWPVASNWYSDNLGGATTAKPDISSWGPNRLDVFARGPDNALYHTWWGGGPWSAWGYMGGANNSGPGAVSWGSGRIDVVSAAANNSTAHAWWAPGWYSDNLGGTMDGDPTISSWGPNRLDIFVRGPEHALWHKFWNGLGWSVWEYIGGDLNSAPGAVSWGNDRIDVVALAANNTVAHTWWAGGKWHSDNLGGQLISAPDIASPEPGRLDLVGRGVENGLWKKTFIQGQGWSGWQRVGGPVYSGVGAVSYGKNRVDVVGMGYNNSVQHWWWQGP